MPRRFVGLSDFCTENGIPWQSCTARHVYHERDIAVGQRNDRKSLLEAGQASDGIRPGIKTVPCMHKISSGSIVQRVLIDIKLEEQGIEHCAVKRVQFDESALALV